MRIPLILAVIAFAGCATNPPKTPHTSALAGTLQQAKASTEEARQSSNRIAAGSDRIGKGIERLDANSSTIDRKATLLLRWIR